MSILIRIDEYWISFVYNLLILRGKLQNIQKEMGPQNIQILIEKYLNGLASPEEIRLVDEFYASLENEPGLTEKLDKKDVEESIQRSFSSIISALKK